MFGIVARSRAYKHVPLLEREREREFKYNLFNNPLSDITKFLSGY